MATEQVFDWIHNELRLSRPISNFETDFANGYLLGEILATYQVIPDTKVFSNRNNKETKVNNFYVIEDALRKLKVRFDAKLIHNIMQEERGAALRLLYQLKLACHKFSRVELADDPSIPSMTGLPNGKMHTILRSKKEQTMETSNTIPPPTVAGKDIRTEKQKRIDKHTIGFEVMQKTQFDKAAMNDADMKRQIERLQQEQRTMNRTKLAENQHFMKEWEKEGKKNWKVNQSKRADGIAHVQYFDDREVNNWRTKLQNEQLTATNEIKQGVDEFENNLQKLGIEQFINMDEAIKRQEEKKGIPPGQIQNFSYAATMNKIKETKKNTEFAGKERERRRRKMMVDQITAQSKLDSKKSEVTLIEKLLKQNKEASEQAYADRRSIACKSIIFDERKGNAEVKETKKKVLDAIQEKKQVEENKILEQEKREKDFIRRRELAKSQRVSKEKKRSLNIEIASGLMDLIMDLSEETFQVMQSNPKNQIVKPQWREFIQLFKEGKQVSLRNIHMLTAAEQDESTLDKIEIDTSGSAYDFLMKNVKEPALSSLYDFLSQCGQFQFSSINPEMWNQFQELYGNNQEGFLSDSLLPNQAVSDCFEKLMGDKNLPTSALSSRAPQCLNFKLAILGRALSGKKTIANQITEKFGRDLKVYSMDKIIQEAIDFASPKEKKEVEVDPKAKGKKTAEVVVVNIFEGKDTSAYKKIGEELKSRFFPGDLPACDLVEQVADDALLVSLFLEKLVLDYTGVSCEEPDLLVGVKREREILEQLEDIDAAGGAPNDAKGKGKGGKGGPDPEKLKQELEEIKRFKATGWILIDFPHTLSQAKILEHSLTGFTSMLYQEKTEDQQWSETWSKLVTPANTHLTKQDQNAYASGFDNWLFVDAIADLCSARVTGRKVDPTTNTVYHPQWNPAPEDPKLADRLQDFNDESGASVRLENNNQSYDRKVASLRKWCQQFGSVNNGVCELALDSSIQVEGTKDKVFESVICSLKPLTDFKQAQFEILRAEAQTVFDELPQTARDQIGQQKTQGNVVKTPDAGQKSQDVVPKTLDGKPATPQEIENLEGHSQLLNNTKTVMGKSKTSEGGHGFGMASSQGGTTMRSNNRKKLSQRTFEINDNQKLERLEKMTNEYFSTALQTFNQLNAQRSRIFMLLNETQSNYVEYLSEGGPLQKRINDFCDSYNRFCSEYPDLMEQAETKKELINRVNILSKQLWQMIVDRKNDALAERQKQIDYGWSTAEKVKLLGYIAALLEQEYNKFHTSIKCITGWVLNEDLDLVGLAKKLIEREISLYEVNDGSPNSPVLEQVMNYLLKNVETLLNESFMHQVPQYVLDGLLVERINFNVKVNSLRMSCLLALEEISYYCEQVFDKLDDWVVISVKRDNICSQKIVQAFKSDIEAKVQYIESPEVDSAQLFSHIQTIKFQQGPPRYMLGCPSSARSCYDGRFSVQNLNEIYRMFKHNGFEELLDQHTFLSLMIQNYQNQRVPQKWLDANFSGILALGDAFQGQAPTNEASEIMMFGQTQDKSLRKLVNWKYIFVLMLLSGSNKPTEEQLSAYITQLKSFGDVISQHDFTGASSWFDRTEGANSASQMIKASANCSEEEDEKASLDYDKINPRLIQIKTLLWQTCKITNEAGLRVSELETVLSQLNRVCYNKNAYGDLIL